MKKVIIISLIFTSFSGLAIKAQQYPLMHFQYKNKLLLNPAYIAFNEDKEFNLHYRRQWEGFEGSPETSVFTFAMPQSKSIPALGFVAFQDKAGLIQRTGVNVNYAYQASLTSTASLSFGISFGASHNQLVLGDLTVTELNDPFLYNFDNSFKADGDFGILFKNNKWELGFNTHSLFQKFSSEEPKSVGKYFARILGYSTFNTSYTFDTWNDFTFTPQIIYRLALDKRSQIEGMLITEFKDIFWSSLGYRKDFGFITGFGLNVNQSISIGYSYELSNQNMGIQGASTNEITLSYQLGKSMKLFLFSKEKETGNLSDDNALGSL